MYEVKDGTVHTIQSALWIYTNYLRNLKEKGFVEDEKRRSKYNLTDEKNGFIVTVNFKKSSLNALVFITVDLTILLNRTYIDEDDLGEVERRIKSYIYNLFHFNIETIMLRRFDFRIDILASDDYRKIIFEVLGKQVPTRNKEYTKNDSFMPQTIYYNSGIKKKLPFEKRTIVVHGQRKPVFKVKHNNNQSRISKSKNILIYNKEQQLLEKGKIDEASKYKDVLRIEVSLKYEHLKYRLKKNGERPELTNYLSKSLCKEIFNNELVKIFEESTFHKLNDAKKLIMRSNLKNKDKLNVFISDINNYSVEVVRNNLKVFGISLPTYNKYKGDLNSIDVNIICLKDKCLIDSLKSPIRLINEFFESLS